MGKQQNEAYIRGMLDEDLLFEIRRENLRSLARDLGSARALADRTDKNEGQLSCLIGEKPSKRIGEKLAREFEEKCGKPKGWMDRVHGINQRLLNEVMDEVDTMTKMLKIPLRTEVRSELVSLCYKLISQHDADKSTIRDVVRLAIKK